MTDDVRNVVIAAAHGQYGKILQTRINGLNAELKFNDMGHYTDHKVEFAGKEQNTKSGFYYFGARYYDPTLYRFLSPDPVLPTDAALYNP